MSLDEKLCQDSTSGPSQYASNKRITSSLIFLPVFIIFLSAKSILTPIARQKMPMEIQVSVFFNQHKPKTMHEVTQVLPFVHPQELPESHTSFSFECQLSQQTAVCRYTRSQACLQLCTKKKGEHKQLRTSPFQPSHYSTHPCPVSVSFPSTQGPYLPLSS